MKQSRALIVFAREPRQGRVKTRLLKVLDPGLVTSLYKAFVMDVLAQTAGLKDCARFLYYADGETEPVFLNQFKSDFELVGQQGKDLGERMQRSASDCFQKGFQKVVIIGSDCLEITSGDLEQAFDRLEGSDFCFGPSSDGGYYLAGMKKFRPEIFTGVEWGTSAVLSKTLEIIGKIEHNVALLDEKEDMDTIESLKRFSGRMETVPGAKETKKILRTIKL
ncbi:MAG: TIGR04282 family arsenosugar biosynthesis glycosyltransferase [Candidatus Omnitrophota bacterium]